MSGIEIGVPESGIEKAIKVARGLILPVTGLAGRLYENVASLVPNGIPRNMVPKEHTETNGVANQRDINKDLNLNPGSLDTTEKALNIFNNPGDALIIGHNTGFNIYIPKDTLINLFSDFFIEKTYTNFEKFLHILGEYRKDNLLDNSSFSQYLQKNPEYAQFVLESFTSQEGGSGNTIFNAVDTIFNSVSLVENKLEILAQASPNPDKIRDFINSIYISIGNLTDIDGNPLVVALNTTILGNDGKPKNVISFDLQQIISYPENVLAIARNEIVERRVNDILNKLGLGSLIGSEYVQMVTITVDRIMQYVAKKLGGDSVREVTRLSDISAEAMTMSQQAHNTEPAHIINPLINVFEPSSPGSTQSWNTFLYEKYNTDAIQRLRQEHPYNAMTDDQFETVLRAAQDTVLEVTVNTLKEFGLDNKNVTFERRNDVLCIVFVPDPSIPNDRLVIPLDQAYDSNYKIQALNETTWISRVVEVDLNDIKVTDLEDAALIKPVISVAGGYSGLRKILPAGIVPDGLTDPTRQTDPLTGESSPILKTGFNPGSPPPVLPDDFILGGNIPQGAIPVSITDGKITGTETGDFPPHTFKTLDDLFGTNSPANFPTGGTDQTSTLTSPPYNPL